MKTILRRDDSSTLNTKFYLLFPVASDFEVERMIDGASIIISSALTHADRLFGTSAEGIFVNLKDRKIWNLKDTKLFSIKTFQKRGIHCISNLGFLTSDDSLVSQMLLNSQQNKIAWRGNRSSRDIYACTIKNRRFRPPFSEKFLWKVLAHLAATTADNTESLWPVVARFPLTPPDSSCFEHSPAMHGVANLRSRRWANSPRFLNTALQELLSSSQEHQPIKGNPSAMAQVLKAQRDASQAPWIFNTLLNEIEYRMGTVQPQSFPPEIHLSITGFCNIECRFCSYTRSVGRFEWVTPEQIAQLDSLKYAQTLRLHSGLGEPTTNKYLPDIIRYIGQNYPHIGINFFTNGLNLDRPGMIDAIVGNVRWINISLNAATRESWKQQCKIDQFDHLCENLQALLKAKQAQRSLWPLVFGSMVLNKANVADLPLMPALCRRLGIDRFTAIPFFALGYEGDGKYGADMTLAACRTEYDELYWQTLEEAKRHSVSIEMPPPSQQSKTAFGLEVRPLNNFAKIETNEWSLGRFLISLTFPESPEYCHFLWRQVGIGSTNNCGHAEDETHYLYPCIGPLSSLDLSRQTSFRFPKAENFLKLWNHPVFSHLREAQHHQGICEVCDLCRQKDTRDPKEFDLLEKAVDRFSQQYAGVDNARQ